MDRNPPEVDVPESFEAEGDWLIASITAVTMTGRAAREEIDALLVLLDKARTDRLAGGDVFAVLQGQLAENAPLARLEVSDAVDRFERELHLMRAGVVRALVDDHHMTLSAVARQLQLSRQLVTRLYQANVRGSLVPNKRGP